MRAPLYLSRILLAGEFRTHFSRVVICVFAVAIGVALGYSVHLVNYAALAELAQATRAVTGQADLEVRGPRTGFDEALYPRLARLPEVAAASPMVEVEAHLPGHQGALKLLGVDVFRAAAVNPGLIGSPAKDTADRLIYLEPDTVFLSPAALTWLGLKPGDTLLVQAGLGTVSLRIAGTLPVTSSGLRVGVMDIAAAQWRFGRLGTLSRINLKLRPGVDVAAFREKLAALLPPGVAATSPGNTQRVTSNLSRAYRVNLDVLALVALFTGAFLVFSSQALSVIRRRSQLALLRALGMTRGGVLRLIFAESLVQGVAGSAIGIALGVGVAAEVLHFVGGDLGGGYFPGLKPRVHVDLITALVFAALGIAATLIGGAAPAWEASRARPALALKAGDEETPLERLRAIWPALGLIVLGVLLTMAPPVAGLPVFGFVAVALLLVGTILLIPRLAHGFFAVLPHGPSLVEYLAAARLSGASGRAAIGLAGVLASFSLVVAMAIMVTSFRVSFDRWLDVTLPAQLYVRAAPDGDTAYFSPSEQTAIASAPGVAKAEFLRTTRLLLNPTLPPVALMAKPVDKNDPGARLALIGHFIVPAPGRPPPLWISEAMTDLYGMHVGDHVKIPIAGRWIAFTIAGVWRDYARQYGAIVVDLDEYRRLTGDMRVTDAALWFVSGVGPARFVHELAQRLPDASRIRFEDPAQIRTASLRIFDRSFAVTYLLEAVAIVIGLFGVGVSFGAQAFARAREFGMLRHVGVTRHQIGLMLALEGALQGLLGVAVGLVLGGGIALILVRIINPQSFHWTMALHVPWVILSVAALTMITLAALTALVSGKRAMSVGAVRAVREDW
ncbi:MAG: FtsX-like permease family protein [Burkholderiaceae bacterium]|nr:MAG: FtsX-like permease family protein [Burkholderiaceae bacterium]TAM03926.1 MAG: FtsX-like permease family protein [Pusillimonas sp.]